MPNSDLPGTLETAHGPVVANASQQNTFAQEKSASTKAVPVLDLRGYELLERLGGGGMGDVYRAGDPALGRDLAVKVMKPDFQENLSAQSRFLREARVTGSLQHPGIVPIYNLGRLTDGRLHYTMRLVRGRTFADVLKEEVGRPERLPALLTIFEKICQAVAYAHSKRVIHRDLKPSNIMVGRFGEVQVMDWGLAKLLTLGEQGCVSAPSEQNECGTRIHTEAGAARSNLATAYQDAHRFTEAIRLHEQTLKQREAKLGADHPDTLTSRNNLAIAYHAAGRIADAIRLHEQTLKQRVAKLGADHPNTLTSRHNLALAYEDAGRTTKAIRLHEQNIKQMESKLGADHPNTLLSMANLGMTYRQAGRLTEAIPLLETALQRGRQRSEGLPASIAWVPNALAQTYDSAGQLGKAEAACRDALAQAQRQFGSDDLRTASALILLGGNLVKQKKYGDAEPLLRQSLTIRQKKQPDAWNTFNARSVLGEALLGQNKYTEAEPLLVQGYEELKQRQDKIPAAHRQLRLSEALERLVRLYEARDQKDKAADWRIKLEEAKAAQKKPKS